MRFRRFILVPAIAMLVVVAAVAQMQVDTRLDMRVNTPVQKHVYHDTDVRTHERISGETRSGTVRYQAKPVLLPSEVRDEVRRSGILPSEWRANKASVGPVTPDGVLKYLNPPPPITAKPVDVMSAPKLTSPDWQQGTIRYGAPPAPSGASPGLSGAQKLSPNTVNVPVISNESFSWGPAGEGTIHR